MLVYREASENDNLVTLAVFVTEDNGFPNPETEVRSLPRPFVSKLGQKIIQGPRELNAQKGLV